MSILCFDTSAIIKLIREERESGALRLWLAEASRRAAIPVCSALALTEVPRALRRLVPGAALPAFVAVLDRFNLRVVDSEILMEAGAYMDPLLRSLDAIHLATARSLFQSAADDFEGLLTYDSRLGSAARALGMRVIVPQ